jgi:hypothetical protein
MKTIGRQLPNDDGAASESPPPLADEPLKLPKGAFLIARKRGGLRFISTEVAVFRDGRFTRTTTGLGVTARPDSGGESKLTRKQVASLRTALADSGMAGAGLRAAGQPNPDGYVYEIVARVGRKVHGVEAFDGGLPDGLKPLIHELNRLSAQSSAG